MASRVAWPSPGRGRDDGTSGSRRGGRGRAGADSAGRAAHPGRSGLGQFGGAPGADLLASPRTAAVPIPVLGGCVAGLSATIVLRLAERDDLGHVPTTTAQLAQALSAIRQVIADCQRSGGGAVAGTAGPVVLAPPTLLNHAARYLEATHHCSSPPCQHRHPAEAHGPARCPARHRGPAAVSA